MLDPGEVSTITSGRRLVQAQRPAHRRHVLHPGGAPGELAGSGARGPRKLLSRGRFQFHPHYRRQNFANQYVDTAPPVVTVTSQVTQEPHAELDRDSHRSAAQQRDCQRDGGRCADRSSTATVIGTTWTLDMSKVQIDAKTGCPRSPRRCQRNLRRPGHGHGQLRQQRPRYDDRRVDRGHGCPDRDRGHS